MTTTLRLTIVFVKVITLLILLTLPSAAHAQFYYVTNNGMITITGYYAHSRIVTIPSVINQRRVTTIAAGAFENKTNINVVTIPDSVTAIGSNAFAGCAWLFGITLPANLKSIEENTFLDC